MGVPRTVAREAAASSGTQQLLWEAEARLRAALASSNPWAAAAASEIVGRLWRPGLTLRPEHAPRP